MIHFRILSGKKAGTSWGARRFPVRIGRSSQADLQMEEGGVWDLHAQLVFKRNAGFVLEPQPNALVRVNGEPVGEVLLRNGDEIEIGALKLQFWLSETRQSSLVWQEVVAWGAIFGVLAGEVALLFWLLQ